MNSSLNIDYNIPFYSNTPDDTHCFQAALRMVLKYFYPLEEYTLEELDIISAKVKGLWTWPTAALIWLQNKGMEVKVITPFEYEIFITKGGDFLLEKYGMEVGESQIEHSDIQQEQDLAKKLLQTVSIEKKIPELTKMYELLQDGYLIICNVNSMSLNNKSGYVGHAVVIKGLSDGKIIIHDPGLPPKENRSVAVDDFEAAWSYPNQEARDIYAFRVKIK